MLTYEANFIAIVGARTVSGRPDTELPTGVAWLLGALLVRTQRAQAAVVAHDAHPASAPFAHRFLRGAINADHYQAHASYAGVGDDEYLRWCVTHLGAVGMHIATGSDDEVTVLRLYRADTTPIEGERLAVLRDLMIADEVPLPVNAQAKGTITDRSTELRDAWATLTRKAAT